MILEVDQSIKVEQTNRDTVIAFSNGEKYALLIPARVKREAAQHFHKEGRPKKQIFLLLFALAAFHLLKGHVDDSTVIVIDVEYEGQEQNIKALLLRFLDIEKRNRPQIVFRSIGKKSGAHLLAISVVRGKRQAHRTITLQEFLKPLEKSTKKRTGKSVT